MTIKCSIDQFYFRLSFNTSWLFRNVNGPKAEAEFWVFSQKAAVEPQSSVFAWSGGGVLFHFASAKTIK